MLLVMQKSDPKIYIREWREARGMTQQQLADAIGRDKSVVSKLERGMSGLTTATLNGIAATLGINPGALYQLPPEGTRPVHGDEVGQVGSISINRQTAVTDGLIGDRPDLPIYASAQGGKTGMVIDFENPVDWVKRPAPLFNVSRGFGMYVVGESMEPAYRQGDMILVHPHHPPTKGDDVLVVKSDGNGLHEALIKQLISADDDKIRLKQWNPREEFSLPRNEVQNIFVIVGRYNRR